jgi:hypothetical protein
MYQHGDSVHAALLHVPLLHSLPPERHSRRLAIPRRQGDLSAVHGFEPVFRIRTHMFLSLRDPDPLVRGT